MPKPLTALDIEKLRRKFPNAPESFFRRQASDDVASRAPHVVEAKRIRQESKPLMNGIESEWFAILSDQHPNFPRPRAQAKRYKLANGAWYKPDVTASSWPVDRSPAMESAWECKGPSVMKNVDRGLLTIKFAAAQWPEVAFYLVWKDKGTWKQQRVLA